MPKFSYYLTDDEEFDNAYVNTEKIIRHKPKKTNHLGKSQNKKSWNDGWN